MSDELKDLQEQIKTLAKRRDDLRAQRVGVDTDMQNLITQLGTAILEGGSQNEIETFKRDKSSTESVLQAIDVAISEAEKRITGLTKRFLAQQRAIAEAEYRKLGDEITEGITDAMQHLFSIGDEIDSLTITFRKMKEIGAPYGIVAGVFLEPQKADAIDAFKLLLGWNFEHRLEVVKRRHPSLDAEIRAKE